MKSQTQNANEERVSRNNYRRSRAGEIITRTDKLQFSAQRTRPLAPQLSIKRVSENTTTYNIIVVGQDEIGSPNHSIASEAGSHHSIIRNGGRPNQTYDRSTGKQMYRVTYIHLTWIQLFCTIEVFLIRNTKKKWNLKA